MDMKCLTAKLDMCKTQFYYYCISIDENLGKDLIMKIYMSDITKKHLYPYQV